MEEGRKPEYPEKTPGDGLQKTWCSWILEDSIKPRSQKYEHQQRETDEHTQNNLLEFSA